MTRLGCIVLAIMLAGALYLIAASWCVADGVRALVRRRPSQAGRGG